MYFCFVLKSILGIACESVIHHLKRRLHNLMFGRHDNSAKIRPMTGRIHYRAVLEKSLGIAFENSLYRSIFLIILTL